MDRVDVIRSRSEFARLEDTWRAVLERCPRRNVFVTWEWVSNWVDVYVEEDRLFVVVIYAGGEPLAIAPLFLEEGQVALGTRPRVLRFLGSGEVCAEHVDVLVVGDTSGVVARRLWDELFGPLRGEWDVFEYYDAPAGSPVFGAFRELAREDKRCLGKEHTGESVCPYLALPWSWEEFLKGCSGSRRYTITYSMKKLAEQGVLEKRFCQNPSELASFMDAFISLHQRSWNARGKPGVFSSTRFERFHRRVAKDFLERGILFLFSLHLDGRHIGSLYGFVYDGTLSYYQMGVETNPVKKIKTGTAVIGYCVEEAIRRGCREFDFLRGAEEYKYRWTSTDRRNPRVRFYNRTGRALTLHVGRSSHEAAKKGVRALLGRQITRLKALLER